MIWSICKWSRSRRRGAAGWVARAGFTLIELLVVVAIIAILIAILLPSLGRARDGAKLVHCASGLRQWGMAVQYYLNDYNQFLPQEGPNIMSATEIVNNQAWYNALPPYVNAPKYYYVYAGVNARTGTSGTDATTGYNWTVTNGPTPGGGGFTNNWIWYCKAKLDTTKNSTSGINSFHYAMNNILDGATSFGGDAGKTHTRVASIGEPYSAVFLFEGTGIGSASDSPAANTAAAYSNQIDMARHKGLGTNLLIVDGHCETVKLKQLPTPQLETGTGVYSSSSPRLTWGPFPSQKVP